MIPNFLIIIVFQSQSAQRVFTRKKERERERIILNLNKKHVIVGEKNFPKK